MIRSFARVGCPLLLSLSTVVACSREAPSRPAANVTPALPVVELTETAAFPLKAHIESADVAAGAYDFPRLFNAGRALFHTPYNGLDGVGIAVRPDGSAVARFAPLGPKGPGAQSCVECHGFPFAAAAGLAHSSVSREPDKDSAPPFNVRSVTSLFGDGILQLLAQEMTEELHAIRDEAAAEAKTSPGKSVRRELRSKGTSYGSIAATAGAKGQVGFDISQVEGIDPDLVVRPMGWKGDAPLVRNITAGAAAGGMGMLGEEVEWKQPASEKKSAGEKKPATENKPAGENRDPDGDGVVRELSVGDITAMTVYSAAQETPTELARLAALGHVKAPSAGEIARIEAGRGSFAKIGCAACHTPEMHLRNTVFEEPTARGNGNYYDKALAKRDPGYDPKRPFRLDILADAQPPRAEAHPEGGAIIRLYGDLKRHAMGRRLADPAGPSESITADSEPLKYAGKAVKIAPDHFLTAELWGVGNTGPWLHDNRAGTLREAILLHGEDKPPAPGRPGRSEAQEARGAFAGLSAAEQESLIAFLRSLQTFSPEKP